jgi:hypothetical protein
LANDDVLKWKEVRYCIRLSKECHSLAVEVPVFSVIFAKESKGAESEEELSQELSMIQAGKQ